MTPHPEERRNTQRTARHLRMMHASQRAQLEREWAASAGTVREPVSPEIRARAAREWSQL